MEIDNLRLQTETEFDQNMTFEVSQDLKVTTKFTYKKGDIVDLLILRVKKLENEVNNLNKKQDNNLFLVQGSLKSIWENEKDDIWNDL